jgi:hypothetical protein
MGELTADFADCSDLGVGTTDWKSVEPFAGWKHALRLGRRQGLGSGLKIRGPSGGGCAPSGMIFERGGW